jgi:hypothetical protein
VEEFLDEEYTRTNSAILRIHISYMEIADVVVVRDQHTDQSSIEFHIWDMDVAAGLV